jgi:hypothetical protein
MVHGSLVVASSPHQLLHNAAAISSSSSSSSSSAYNGGSSSYSAQQQTAAAGSGAAATSAAAAIAHLGPIAYFVRPDSVLNTQLTASVMKVSAYTPLRVDITAAVHLASLKVVFLERSQCVSIVYHRWFIHTVRTCCSRCV